MFRAMGRIIGSGENDHNGLSSSTNDNDNENAAAEDVESGTVQNDEKATVQIRNDEEAAASVVFPPKQPTSFWSRLGNWVAPIDPEYEARRLKQLTAQFESLDLKGGSAAPATSATTTTTETTTTTTESTSNITVIGSPPPAAAEKVPPMDMFPTPSIRVGANEYEKNILCQHCNQMTPLKPTLKGRPIPQSLAFDGRPTMNLLTANGDDQEVLKTPSPTITSSANTDPRREVNFRILECSVGTAKSLKSPPGVKQDRDKLFRMAGNSKPLSAKMNTRLKTALQNDPEAAGMRATRLGDMAPEGDTLLMTAARNAPVDTLQTILEAAPQCINYRNATGQTALHVAAEAGHAEKVELLVKYHEKLGLKVDDLVDIQSITPFGAAILSKNPSKKIEQILFSPNDKSVKGTPAPPSTRQKIFHSLGICYGQAEMPGKRITTEDALCTAHWVNVLTGDVFVLLGVCDGHSDQGRVAKIVVEKMALLLQEFTKTVNQDQPIDWAPALEAICLEVDGQVKETGMSGGSTGVFALVTRTQIIVVNVGDSRCILVRKRPSAASHEGSNPAESVEDSTNTNFEAVALSEDHKPDREREAIRIKNAGLQLRSETFKEKDGTEVTVYRVMKNIKEGMAVSRSFGDFDYKKAKELEQKDQAVTAVPDVKVYTRDDEIDMFLVLACDGIWDVMSNEEVAKFVVDKVAALDPQEPNSGALSMIGDDINSECYARDSGDNMSVIIAALSKCIDKFSTSHGTIKGKALTFPDDVGTDKSEHTNEHVVKSADV